MKFKTMTVNRAEKLYNKVFITVFVSLVVMLALRLRDVGDLPFFAFLIPIIALVFVGSLLHFASGKQLFHAGGDSDMVRPGFYEPSDNTMKSIGRDVVGYDIRPDGGMSSRSYGGRGRF